MKGSLFGSPSHEKQGSPEKHQASPTEIITLQTLMEIKESIGELKSDIKAINEKVTAIDTKTNDIECKVSGVTHKLYAAGVVVTMLIIASGFIIDKAWDTIANKIEVTQSKN